MKDWLSYPCSSVGRMTALRMRSLILGLDRLLVPEDATERLECFRGFEISGVNFEV